MRYPRCRWIVWIGVIAIACAISPGAQNPEALTAEQMRNFLLNGKVVKSRLVYPTIRML